MVLKDNEQKLVSICQYLIPWTRPHSVPAPPVWPPICLYCIKVQILITSLTEETSILESTFSIRTNLPKVWPLLKMSSAGGSTLSAVFEHTSVIVGCQVWDVVARLSLVLLSPGRIEDVDKIQEQSCLKVYIMKFCTDAQSTHSGPAYLACVCACVCWAASCRPWRHCCLSSCSVPAARRHQAKNSRHSGSSLSMSLGPGCLFLDGIVLQQTSKETFFSLSFKSKLKRKSGSVLGEAEKSLSWCEKKLQLQ